MSEALPLQKKHTRPYTIGDYHLGVKPFLAPNLPKMLSFVYIPADAAFPFRAILENGSTMIWDHSGNSPLGDGYSLLTFENEEDNSDTRYWFLTSGGFMGWDRTQLGAESSAGIGRDAAAIIKITVNPNAKYVEISAVRNFGYSIYFGQDETSVLQD